MQTLAGHLLAKAATWDWDHLLGKSATGSSGRPARNLTAPESIEPHNGKPKDHPKNQIIEKPLDQFKRWRATIWRRQLLGGRCQFSAGWRVGGFLLCDPERCSGCVP